MTYVQEITYVQKISKFRGSESRVGLSGYVQVIKSTPCISCLAMLVLSHTEHLASNIEPDDGIYIGRNM